MRVVVSAEFFEKRQLEVVGDVELFTFGNCFIHVLNIPEFTPPVEGTHDVEEDAAVVR